MSQNRNYDVIIIGGGPAGSTAASILSMHGRRVILLEKEKFPRYHIGESLMPYCYFPLERIGVIERMKNSHFPKKYSVQFVSINGKASQPFYFFQHLKHEASTTWQVLRSEFDLMLLNNAREKGARVLEETKVTAIIQDDGAAVGVKAVSKSGEEMEFRAPVIIDSSGRDAFSVARNSWRVPDQKLKKIALWTYYKGALRDPGLDEGATTVAFLPDKGWFWYIPLPYDVVSVGVVAEGDYLFDETRDFATIWQREVKKNKWVEEHLAPGKQVSAPRESNGGPFYTTSEWSYRSRYCAMDGLVLAGDAFGFLDPVFSSGVFLALKSGELVADTVHAALEAGDVSAERFRDYGDTMRKGIEAMRNLVYAFYDHEFSMREFINKYPHMHGDVTDCLIGNLFRDFDELFKAVGEFAELPAPLPHGKPLTS